VKTAALGDGERVFMTDLGMREACSRTGGSNRYALIVINVCCLLKFYVFPRWPFIMGREFKNPLACVCLPCHFLKLALSLSLSSVLAFKP